MTERAAPAAVAITAAPLAPNDSAAQAARRAARMLEGPVLATILVLAAPNVVVMLAQALANFLESYYVGLIGVDALAGAALVFPLVMLMQMMSAGGIGGGISSAIARALGAGRHADAEALALHALVIALAAGALFGIAAIAGGPLLYAAMGGYGAALAAALAYSNVIFAGAIFLWLANSLASILRGTGNMRLPALVLASGSLILFAVSPVLIFGLGPLPGLGIAGAGLALVIYYVVASAVLAINLFGGKSGLTFSLRHRLRWTHFADILGVGSLSVVNNVTANIAVVVATGLVGPLGTHALAGFGLGIRLEYLQIPIVFGFGTGMVAMVGMNVGAGQFARARTIAWTGALVCAAVTETVGLAAAIFPHAWLGLFTSDGQAIAIGADYLRVVAPAYGLFGFGLALYFAGQGARRMRWPVTAGIARLVVVAVLGTAALRGLDLGLTGLLLAVVAGLAVFAGVHTVPWLRAPAAPRRARERT